MIRRLALVAALAVTACSSLDRFDVPLSADGTIPGSLSSLPGTGFPRGFPGGGDIGQKIENQGVDAGDVTSAKLKAGTITVTAPSDGHLAYITSFELFVKADGQERKRIAHQAEAFASRPSKVDLVLDDVELKPYITAPAMEIVPEVTLRSKPMNDVSIRVDLTLGVDLSIIE